MAGTIKRAMELIEENKTDLAGALPKDAYQHLHRSDTTLLKSLLRTYRS